MPQLLSLLYGPVLLVHCPETGRSSCRIKAGLHPGDAAVFFKRIIVLLGKVVGQHPGRYEKTK